MLDPETKELYKYLVTQEHQMTQDILKARLEIPDVETSYLRGKADGYYDAITKLEEIFLDD